MHLHTATALLYLAFLSGGDGLRVFRPSSITIRRQVGQLGFATETEWQYAGGKRNPLDPSQPSRTVEASGASVRLFEARLADGSRSLLKEFLGAEARAIGDRELAVYRHLEEEAGGAPDLSVGTLCGHMISDEAFETRGFREAWEASFGLAVPPPAAGRLWLIFRWVPLRTIGGFARVEQPPAGLAGLFDWGAAQARREWVRTASRESLRALAALHAAGVAHRSLGSSSLLVSTYEQREAARLRVTLVDLGFAATPALLSAEEIAAAMRQAGCGPTGVLPLLTLYDLHGLGYVLLELVLSALVLRPAGGGGGVRPPPELQQLKRLVEDVFSDDVARGFRDYCAEEPGWEAAVALLDEGGGAGWDLLQSLVDCHTPAAAGSVSAQSLLDSSVWLRPGGR